jgi:hypothetical protein
MDNAIAICRDLPRPSVSGAKPEPFMNERQRHRDKAVYFGGDTVILARLPGRDEYSGKKRTDQPRASTE